MSDTPIILQITEEPTTIRVTEEVVSVVPSTFIPVVGTPGATGAQGPTGQTGPQGPAGAVGGTGATGVTGPQGPQGSSGPVGATGIQGPQGPVGVTGATGIQGPQGPAGVTGATGIQGPIGVTGPQGPIGQTGPAGTTSFTGLTNVPVGLVSSSTQVTYGQLTGLPVGILSSSVQFNALTNTSASYAQNAFNAVSASWAPGVGGGTTWDAVSNKPVGIVSSSVQVQFSGISGVPSGLISSSAQVNYTGLTGVPVGIVSSSNQVDFLQTTNRPVGLVSSSAQIAAGLPAGTVSSSAQVAYAGLSGVPVGIVSASAQVIPLLPAGTVSSSAQVNYAQLQNTPVGILSSSVQLNLLSNVSASWASRSISSSFAQDAFAQWNNINGRPSGLVSASNQIDFLQTTNRPTGLVSSSVQAAVWTVATASVSTTSSYAVVAQNVLGSITSASYALTASYALNGGGGGSGDFAATASYISGTAWTGGGTFIEPVVNLVSASYALTASYVQGGGGGSSDWSDITNRPTGLVSSSIQAETWTVATSSYVEGVRSVVTDFTASNIRVENNATVQFQARNSRPPTPQSGTADFYFRTFGGRLVPSWIGPGGFATPLQPGLFNNNVSWLTVQQGTTVGVVGNTATNIGTVSHPTPTERYGRMVNLQTGAGLVGTTISASAAMTDVSVIRGTSVTGSGGFFFGARLAFPDTNYSNPTAETGSRVFVGLTNATMNGAIANPSSSLNNAVGFRLQIPLGETSWSVVARDGTNLTVQNTGMGFTAESVYDFYLFCPPSGTQVGWRIDNALTGEVRDGIISGTLPGATTYLRAGFDTNGRGTGTARNFRFQRIYLESDR